MLDDEAPAELLEAAGQIFSKIANAMSDKAKVTLHDLIEAGALPTVTADLAGGTIIAKIVHGGRDIVLGQVKIRREIAFRY